MLGRDSIFDLIDFHAELASIRLNTIDAYNKASKQEFLIAGFLTVFRGLQCNNVVMQRIHHECNFAAVCFKFYFVYLLYFCVRASVRASE